jgi:hypothetical protein
MKVVVLEACDGFSIDVYKEDKLVKHFWFSQEDDKTELVQMFNLLGFNDVEYEEDY